MSARKPIDLDTTDARAFVYDHNEDSFSDEDGNAIRPAQILDDIYNRHYRTLRLGFRIRWNSGSGARWVINRSVWRGQDAATRALFHFYDVELSDKVLRESRLPNPFHKYRPSDFRRITDDPKQHCLGFQSSLSLPRVLRGPKASPSPACPCHGSAARR